MPSLPQPPGPALPDSDGPSTPPGTASAGDAFEFSPATLTAATGIVLVPLSSYLGVQGWTFGWLWIWQPSIFADIVFVLGTIGAHVAAVEAGRRVRNPALGVLVAIAAGWLLHWLVYGFSWELVLATEPEEDFSLPGGLRFVASVGYFGLTLAALAAGGALVWRRRLVQVAGAARAGGA